MEEEKTQSQNSSTDQNSYLIPGAIIVAGALIAGAVVYSNQTSQVVKSDKSGTAAVSETSPDGAAALSGSTLEDDDPVLGNPDAPVVIVEFGDFQCPFCKRFFDTARKDLIEKYIRTGKVKFVYRDFPLEQIHPYARPTAEGAECADEQGKYWPYHDALYEKQSEFGSLNFVTLAKDLGLDVEQFKQCFETHKYKDEVTKDYNDGLKAGVNGTPANFINGRLIPGAQPFNVFELAIEEELKKLENKSR